MGRRSAGLRAARVIFLTVLLVAGCAPNRAAYASPLNYLHAEGSQIVDSYGRRVVLTGINWFGLETPSFAPHGLWARNWEEILDQIRDLGFNTIRLPYSNQLLDPSSLPNGIDYLLNPDLEGLSGLEIMDKIVAGAGARGLKIILDRHRPGSEAQSDLWYTPRYDEERWITDWRMLAQRYASNDTVIGVDLHNEPHGRATWGTGDLATDWRLAAERAGNAILEVNPELLIIVQGIDQYQGDWYWWGGNLMGARDHPVRLTVPSQLVYSSHVYGPGVYPQPWFWDPAFPDNLPAIWDRHWGYLSLEGVAPVIIGEFGGRSVGDDREGIWQRTLVSYLRQHSLSYFYWTINPNSGDTGGLLLDDWRTVDPGKLALLSGYQFPLLGIEEVAEAGRPPSRSLLETEGRALSLRYRTANPVSWAHDSKPEFVLVNADTGPISLSRAELRYWFADETGQGYVFHCDWAGMGCAQVMGGFGQAAGDRRYLGISFRAEAGALLPGEDTGEIKVRFNRADWSQFLQSDDYSFVPVGEYVEWPRVTVYLDGVLVWGEEPSSDSIWEAMASESLGPRPGQTADRGAPAKQGPGPSLPQAEVPGSVSSPVDEDALTPAYRVPRPAMEFGFLGLATLATLIGVFKIVTLWGGRRR